MTADPATPILYRRFPEEDECGTRRGSRWCPHYAGHTGPCGLDLAVVEGRPRYKDSAYYARPTALAVDQIWRDPQGRTVRLTREEEGRWYADGPCEWIDHARLIDGIENWEYLGTRDEVDARPERPTPPINWERVAHFVAAIEEGERRAATMTEEEKERERRLYPIPWTRGNGWGHPS